MSPRRNWDSPAPSLDSECAPPPAQRARGRTRLRVRGWGSHNSDDWKKAQHSAYSLGPGFNTRGPHPWGDWVTCNDTIGINEVALSIIVHSQLRKHKIYTNDLNNKILILKWWRAGERGCAAGCATGTCSSRAQGKKALNACVHRYSFHSVPLSSILSLKETTNVSLLKKRFKIEWFSFVEGKKNLWFHENFFFQQYKHKMKRCRDYITPLRLLVKKQIWRTKPPKPLGSEKQSNGGRWVRCIVH